ncbi:hypothetical protein ACFV6Y_39270 [Streptomyces massasporeus]|uniref:hypothetical protein n=1 Tax=Streptomyces massasporeus TaxID=67324 RepID=UPI0036572A20
MADLQVSLDGLVVAAKAGEDVALTLSASPAETRAGNRHGHAGVAAMDAALASAREGQSARASEFSDGLRVATGNYRTTDDGGAQDIAVTL